MMSVAVEAKTADAWRLISSKSNRAVVFIDNASAESLHWAGGASLLFKEGALNIKELSSFESAGADHKKAVFITSSVLFDTTASIIQDIIESSSFEYVIVITSLSASFHLYAKTGSLEGDEKDVFYQFEEKLLEWMGNMNFTAEVQHIPFQCTTITHDLFVLPAHGDFFPLLPGDQKKIEFELNKGKITSAERKKIEKLGDVEFSHLPEELRKKYMSLVSNLNDLMDQLNVRDDCYAVGQTSRLLASELANYAPAKGRRKAATNKASILFVDRTLDVAGPSGHQGENIVDKVRSLLPRLPMQKSDVCVNMANLCSLASNDVDSSVIVPGCLAPCPNSKSATLLNTLVHSKQKEAMMELNKQLVEAAMKENLPLKMSGKPGRITAELLESHVRHFKANNPAIQNHSGLLQISNAVIQALRHSQYPRLDALLSIEKLLLQNSGDEDCPSAASQIILLVDREMKKPVHERELSLEELFYLLLFTYSLVEDVAHSVKEENLLMELMTGAITTDQLPETLDALFEDPKSNEKVKSRLKSIFLRLNSLSTVRKDLKKFSQIYDPGGVTSPASYKPLLQQIIEQIFNPNEPELVDIEHKSSGLKDLLKSGFGYFMTVKKPRPNDHPLLIIFIVGGVTTNEVKQVQDTLSKYQAKTQVVVGSTCLVKPSDILKNVLSKELL